MADKQIKFSSFKFDRNVSAFIPKGLRHIAQRFDGAGSGNESVLTWGRTGAGAFNIQHHLGGDISETYRRPITISLRLPSDKYNRIAAVDGRLLFCRTDQGALVAYDAVEGGWAPLPNAGVGWDALGQMGDYVIALRRVANGADLMALKANAQQQGAWTESNRASGWSEGARNHCRSELERIAPAGISVRPSCLGH